MRMISSMIKPFMNDDTDKNIGGGTKPFATGAQASKPVTPNSIAHEKYPRLKKHGDPFSYTIVKRIRVINGTEYKVDCWSPDAVNETWFGAFLAELGYVFDEEAGAWFGYVNDGYFAEVSAENMHRPIEWLMKSIAKKCPDTVDTKRLHFQFQSVKAIPPMITKGRGFAAVRSDYWKQSETLIPVRNGVLAIVDMTLRPHSPISHFR